MGDSQTTKHLATGDVVPWLMCGLASRSVALVRHEANDRSLSLAIVQEDKGMVKWTSNATIISIRIDNGLLIVEGPSGHETANNLQQALARVRAALNGVLAGATGVTGWSLTLEFPGIRAPYGDAPRNFGNGKGRPTEVGACTNAIYDPKLQAHPAIANSIEIVKHCWSISEAVA